MFLLFFSFNGPKGSCFTNEETEEIKGEWAMKRNMTGLYPWKKDRNCPFRQHPH